MAGSRVGWREDRRRAPFERRGAGRRERCERERSKNEEAAPCEDRLLAVAADQPAFLRPFFFEPFFLPAFFFERFFAI